MNADLTCSTCDGIGRDFGTRCLRCEGTGRRQPTLAEWDALMAERDELLDLLGPDYHVADVREDGWSIQHPIPCRRSMLLDCDLHRVAVHDWQEPPAPLGRYRADLTDDQHIVLAALGREEM